MDAGNSRVLSDVEVERLKAVAAALPLWQAVIGLMVDVGLRRAEVFALRAGDVDRVKGELRRPRVVSMSSGLVERLRQHVEYLDEEDLIFGWNWHYPRVRREWRELTRRAGSEGTSMHVLRSTCLFRSLVERRAVPVVEPPHRSAVLRRRPSKKGTPSCL